MLDLSKTQMYDSKEVNISASASGIEPGQALVQAIENGLEVVTPSTGTSGELFVGVAFAGEAFRPTTQVIVETFTNIANASPVTLKKSPTAVNAISVRLNGTAAGTVSASAVAGTGTVQVNGTGNQTMTFDSADNGKTAVVTYRYTLTVTEAQMFYGDAVPGISAADATKTIGVITQGVVYTNCFDTAADWNVSNIANIKTGASGRFVRGGSGFAVSGRVIAVPTADYPFLGLWINN